MSFSFFSAIFSSVCLILLIVVGSGRASSAPNNRIKVIQTPSNFTINIPAAAKVTGKKYIDFYIKSYPVNVVGEHSVTSYFGENLDRKYSSLIRPIGYEDSHVSPDQHVGLPRGIPPSNWVKFSGPGGLNYGLFCYKSLNRCDRSRLGDSGSLYDLLGLSDLRASFKDQDYYETRTSIATLVHTQSVTAESVETYLVTHVFNNFTLLPGAHSDVRVIPFDRSCDVLLTTPGLEEAHFVLAGAAHASGWKEKQFIAVLDGNFRLLRSWVLADGESARFDKSQKNWLPFWSDCRLMLSKRYAPEHVVGEFRSWDVDLAAWLRSGDKSRSKDLRLDDGYPYVNIWNVAKSPSPASVPNPYFVRGSAPVLNHPLFKPGYAIGCVHLRGRFKVYRHVLFLQQTHHPFSIVQFSPLFAFSPYRDIEFVMSMVVRSHDYGLEISYGSMDCEPRIAVLRWSKLKRMFDKFVL